MKPILWLIKTLSYWKTVLRICEITLMLDFLFQLVLYSREDVAPDKAAYCVFTQFLEPKNAIKFISVRTKAQ